MSAFHLLKILPESSRSEIDNARDDASFDERASEDALQKAVDALAAPVPRLREEVSYFWGMPLPQIDELHHLAKADTDGGLFCKGIRKMPLPALTKANLAALFCEHGNVGNANNLIDAVDLLIAMQKDIDAEDVRKMVNHARKKSTVVPVAKSEHITDALVKLRESHMKSAANVIFCVKHPGELATKITEKYRFDKTSSGRFVADLISGAYKNRIQDTLRPLEEQIDQAANALRDSPRDELLLNLLEQTLYTWDEYAQPIQLINEGKGFDEKRSSEICHKLRDLALHLNNKEDESEISLRITKLLNKVFLELPEGAEVLAKDLDVLESIVNKKHQNAKLKERLQVFKNAVASFQNKPSDILKFMDTFSGLLRKHSELANEEGLWSAARSVALNCHNKHGATDIALILTKKLLLLAERFNAPQSICDQLSEDKSVLEKIVSRSVAAVEKPSNSRYFWIILALLAFIILVFYAIPENEFQGKIAALTESYASQHRRQVYVTASKLTVRKSPNGEEVGSYTRYQNLTAVGLPRNGWQKIVGPENSYNGYVSVNYIKDGDGAVAAKISKCEKSVARPKNGTILSIPTKTGTSSISVHNGSTFDVIIKLRDQSNKTAVVFYLQKNESYVYGRVPNEHLLFTYATGKNYSTKCEIFMDDMRAYRSPSMDDYYSSRWTYKLKPVEGGNFRPQDMSAENF